MFGGVTFQLVEDNINCTQARACNIATNPNCLQQITVTSTVDMCTSVGAVAGDNCVDSANLNDCADKTDCTKDPSGQMCNLGNPAGKVQYQLPIDGGTCTVGG